MQLNSLLSPTPPLSYDLAYLTYTPALNQSLWYYFTLHTDQGGLDTPWQRITPAQGLASSPTSPPTSIGESEADGSQALLDLGQGGETVVYERGFAWEAGVVAAASDEYRIAFATNATQALLWLNVQYQVDGDAPTRAAMQPVSALHWQSPPLPLTVGDVLLYNFTWWALATNAEVHSGVTTLYRLPTPDAAALTAAVAAGKTPGGTLWGDGQNLWGSIAASVPSLSAAAPAPSLPALPASSAGGGSSSSASVVSAISSGITSLLSSLSPAQVVQQQQSAGPSSAVSIQSTSSQPVEGGAAATGAGLSTQSLLSLLTPLSIVGSLAGLATSSPTSSSSLTSLSTYVGSAFCVLPCATSSPTTDVMVSCLGGCMQPFMPAGMTSSQASTLVNSIHDYLLSSIASANTTSTSTSTSASTSTSPTDSLSATSPTSTLNTTVTNITAALTLPAAANTTTPSPNVTTSKPATPSTTTTSTPMDFLPALPAPSGTNAALASAVAQWLLANAGSASSTTASLLPPPITTLGGALSSGLGALSSPLLSGLSALGTGSLSVQSNAPAHSISLTSATSSLTLPISALVTLFSPLLLPSPVTPASVGAAATYVGGLTCMLPCITSATVGVQGTSTCIGSCVDAVVPNAGGEGAALVNYIDGLFRQWVPPQTVAVGTGGTGVSAGGGEAAGSSSAGVVGTGEVGLAAGSSSGVGGVSAGPSNATKPATPAVEVGSTGGASGEEVEAPGASSSTAESGGVAAEVISLTGGQAVVASSNATLDVGA